MPRGKGKTPRFILGTLTPPSPSFGTQVDERKAIVETLEQFTRAWFTGDAEALERCFHPELTARLLRQGPDPEGLRALALDQGIQAALRASARPLDRRAEITVLDATGHSASARILLGDRAVYVHLAFTGQRWALVNMLWEWRSPGDRRSA